MMSIILFIIFKVSFSCILITFSNEQIEEIMEIDASLTDHQYSKLIDFGLWSKYQPLKSLNQDKIPISQGKICYLNMKVIDKDSNQVHLLHYDCLDYEQMKISKNIDFFDQTGIIQKYNLKIDNQFYESIWYFFSFQYRLNDQKFSFQIADKQKEIFYKSGNYQHPNNINLKIIIGGYIENDSFLFDRFNLDIQTLNLFPGEKYICVVSDTLFDPFQVKYKDFECQDDFDIKQIQLFEIKQLDIFRLGLKYNYCDLFSFSTWIKIKKIQTNQENYTFKLIQISAWNENTQLQNRNLSPFQLFYKINNGKIYVQFTTYSYTLPIVSINFEDDPFLLSQEFELINDYDQWGLLNVAYEYELFSCSLQFLYQYHNENNYGIWFENVKHFKEVQLQVKVGNLNKDENNYIEAQFYDLVFLNSYNFNQVQECHLSCFTCDGPTQFDCLSCDQNSKRIYLKSQKSCMCTFGSVDDGFSCKSYQQQGFVISNIILKQKVCPYGYFSTSNDECKQCPTSISKSYFYCLECIQNPNDWQYNSICETTIYFDQNNQKVASQIKNQKEQLIFDSEDLNICKNCQNNNSIELQYQNFLNTQLKQIHNKYQDKIICIEYCSNCKLYIEGIKCLQCEGKLINDYCQRLPVGLITYCIKPNYYNSQYICIPCKISNCQYCFEYLSNDLTKCTLYKNQKVFEIDQYHKVGCALCDDGYIFDFTLGQCIQKVQRIPNCLRSFINQDGIEKCTLSSIDDFSVAPQIINCKYIENCKECILTPFKVIKCIICKTGYVASTISGKCEQQYYMDFTILGLEGNYRQGDAWVQLIQSFLMQFLQYFYPSEPNSILISSFSIECIDGYHVNSRHQCVKYCTKECLNCQEINDEFICLECPLNQYGQLIRSSVKESCLDCPQMCAVCIPRDSSEILQLNPQFILTSDNEKFTLKCLMAVIDSKIIIDTNLQIARYLYTGSKNEILVYQVNVYIQGMFEHFKEYESEIDHNYLNQIGATQLQINFRIDVFQDHCSSQDNYITFSSTLKQKVFSLNHLISRFSGKSGYNFICQQMEVDDFDSQTMTLSQKFTTHTIMFQQNLHNLIFFRNMMTFQNTSFQVGIKHPKKFIMQNITFKNIYFTSYQFLNLSLQNIDGSTVIQSLKFIQCKFEQTICLNFYTFAHSLNFKTIIFEHCIFQNSEIFNFFQIANINFQELQVIQSEFYNSTLINGDIKLISFVNLVFTLNLIRNSNLVILKKDVQVINAQIENNEFYNSTLFQIIIYNEIKCIQKFKNFSFILNQFENSQIFQIEQISVKNHEITFDYFKFFNNKFVFTQTTGEISFLLQIQCNKLLIQNLSILNQVNLRFIQMKDVSDIVIKNVQNYALKEEENVNSQLWCSKNQGYQSLFSIIEFDTIHIENFTIINQNILDSIVIEIISKSTNQLKSGKITFKEIFFQNNILKNLQKSQVTFIYLSAKKISFISFNQIKFIDNFYYSQSLEVMLDSFSFLLFIECQSCITEINTIYCEKNMLFNSTNSFLKITTNQLRIDNFYIKQHNLIKQTDLEKYLQIDLKVELDQEQINSLINQIYGIKNKGCGGAFFVNQISIENGFFSDLLAQNVPLFEITTFSDGIIYFQNLSVSNVTLLYSTTQEYKGTIHINSANSFLQLEIKNSFFVDLVQYTNTPILSITPSNFKNQIILQNLDFQNCFSIYSLIISFNMVNLQDQSYIKIKKISFLTNIFNFEKFIKNIEKQRIFKSATMTQNSLMEISGCKLIIKDIEVQGIVFSKILSITDLPFFSLLNSNFQNISQVIPSNLFQIDQIIFQNFILIIKNCKFFNIYNLNYQQLEQKQYFKNFKLGQTIELIPKNCYMVQDILEIVEEFYSSYILEQINFKMNGAIIFISNVNQRMQIFLFQNQIINNQCTFCLDGGIYIDFVQKSKITISDLICYKNIFKQNGCLNLISSIQNGELVKIINSKFLNNQGTQGVGVSSVNMKLQIENCYFMNNNATDKGGAIYIENLAYMGGGIYLNSEKIGIDDQSLQNSLLTFNYADTIGNNLVDQPTHFQLTINNVEFNSAKINAINRQLELKPYKIIEQGLIKFSNVLMLPSGQQIKTFKLFNPKQMAFYHYIKSIIFSIHNSLNEKQNNLTNTSCFLYETLYDQNLLKILDPQLIKQIHFDEEKLGFDLSDFSFNLDPYSNHNMMIDILCQKNLEKTTENSGEFFVAENCQVCDSQQGYYSVNYNVTKCSIFDKEKFEAITSNQIKLKPGCWRPNIYSDLTEYCLKNPDYCVGGWKGGNHLCTEGHVGALCEECDIYNLIGNGKFQKVQKIKCANCESQNQNIFNYLLTILWSILSLFISLRSVNKSKQLFRILILNNRFGKIIFKFDQDYSGFILKMLLNYLWIFSVTFGLNLNYQFNFNVIDQTSNSSYYLASNIDCFLSESFNMELIYLRILVTYLYILSLFVSMNFILLISSKISNIKFDKSAITNCLLYLYVQNNSSIIQNFSSLISQRKVSNISFIQGDVSLRFDTETHQEWIKYFIIPNLIFIYWNFYSWFYNFLFSKKEG